MDHDGKWRPYITGALTGVLAIASVWVTTSMLGKTQYLGASTTFVRAAGYVGQLFASEAVAENAYFSSTGIKVDWQFMILVGIILGAFLSSLIGKSFALESVPPIWKERFGARISVRAVGAFLGGVVAMFGARLADGCPSGHGLSGLMQLSMSGFLSMAGFFGAGVVTAHLLYKTRRVS